MKTARARGASLLGAEAELVTVEGRFDDRKRERVEVVITGLPDPVIRESRGRLVSALEENRLRLRTGRLFLNLVPAARKKSGEALDLALALAAASALGYLEPRALEGVLFLGELGIDGTLHAIPGGTAAALAARRAGVRTIVAPPATAREAACVPDVEAHAAKDLSAVLRHLSSSEQRLAAVAPPPELGEAAAPEDGDSRGDSLDEVRGQAPAKLALAAAAAGGHPLLFVGPPGTGKSMLARGLVRLLPRPGRDERVEMTAVLSAVGAWPGGLVSERPFRAPHHTASDAGIVGGGPQVSPGEITLAHGGVLFLDELPEFKRTSLEALRQPLETGEVQLARATRRVTAPARFRLVAAMNPCPCGYLGHERVGCRCSRAQVERYRRRISGPLLDRIDLRVEVRSPGVGGIAGAGRAAGKDPAGTREQELVAAIRRARGVREERAQGHANARLSTAELDRWVPLDEDALCLFRQAEARRGLSARGLQAVRRVARTLADLDGRRATEREHLLRALALRAPLEPP